MSHGVCRPVADLVLGARLDGPEDIAAIAARFAHRSMDLLEAAHTFSGVGTVLRDLLGRAGGEPTWPLLGHERAHPTAP